jgi:hypothetical protein
LGTALVEAGSVATGKLVWAAAQDIMLSSGNRIFGYQIPELYFGSAFLKPEFLITRKNRPELSGKTECPALVCGAIFNGCDLRLELRDLDRFVAECRSVPNFWV